MIRRLEKIPRSGRRTCRLRRTIVALGASLETHPFRRRSRALPGGRLTTKEKPLIDCFRGRLSQVVPHEAARKGGDHGGTRGSPVGTSSRALALVRVLNLALSDFFEGHRQVVLRARLHERGGVVVEGALAELVVVVVDLPRALGGDDHERVSLRNVVEECVDAWVDHGRDMLAESLDLTISPLSPSAGSTSAF